jgi:hypothetical protein
MTAAANLAAAVVEEVGMANAGVVPRTRLASLAVGPEAAMIAEISPVSISLTGKPIAAGREF